MRTGERYAFVPVESIDWIESANNYTLLHCRSRNHVFSENLTALEHLLDPAQFVPVHRSRMINMARVVAVSTIAGGVFELELQGGVRVTTGRLYGDRVRKLLKAGQ